jgi:hypothetical protein
MLAAKLTTREGEVDVDALLSALKIDKTTLAALTGLSRDALGRTARLSSRSTQKHLADLADVIVRVTPWTGSPAQALAWYRAQPLPSFGDLTPQDLFLQGRVADLKAYLSRIAEGGYA